MSETKELQEAISNASNEFRKGIENALTATTLFVAICLALGLISIIIEGGTYE